METLYFIRVLSDAEPYNKENIIDILKLDDIPDDVQDDVISKKLKYGWIKTTEDIYKQSLSIIIESRKWKGLLMKTDISLTRYNEEKILVDAGELDETYLSESEYLDLLKKRKEYRANIQALKETAIVKREFVEENWGYE